MKEPLADGWKKECYSYQEALRIVIYWRYDGPHPATDGKPSREARLNAVRDISKIMKSEPVAVANIQPRPRPRRKNWVTSWRDSYEFGKPGWGLHEQDSTIGTTTGPSYPRDISYDNLITLCPGVFNTIIDIPKANNIPKTETGRPPELKEAVAMAIDLMNQGKPQGEAAKEAALHYFSHENGKVTTRIDSIERTIRKKRNNESTK